MIKGNSILIVAWSFPPVRSPRALKAEAILKGLYSEFKHITVLTRSRSSRYLLENYSNIDIVELKDTELWQLRFNHGKSHTLGYNWLKRIFNGLLKKFFNYPDFAIYFRVLKAARQLRVSFYDVCITVDGPQTLQWAVAYLRWRGKLNISTWISDNGDPLTRGLPGNKVAPYFKLMEDFFCSQADYITVPVDDGYSYFRAKYANKIFVIPHSLIFPEDQLHSQLNEASSVHATHQGSCSFAYAGNMMPYQKQARSFFDHLAKVYRSFSFHIFGANHDLVDSLIELYPSLEGKVIQHGMLERTELLRILGGFDFLVYFPYNNTGQIPFKLIDYAFSKLPVLAYREGENVLVDSFIKGDYSNRSVIPDYKLYDYRITTKKYLDLIS